MQKMNVNNYPIKTYRSNFEIIFSWFLVIFSIYIFIHHKFCFLYPFILLIIVNRMVALMFMAHEAVHGNLHRKKRVNSFIARYFCSFPILMSFSKFKRFHLLHHLYLNIEDKDPNFNAAKKFPATFNKSFLNIKLILSVSKDFMRDNSEIFETFYYFSKRSNRIFHDSEPLYYFSFTFFFIFIIIYILGFYNFILLYLVPLYLFHFYILIMTGLQHSPIEKKEEKKSRDIIGNKLLMMILLPCQVNFHGTHHYAPQVPFYWLRELSLKLENQNQDVAKKQSYLEAFRELIIKS